MSDGPICLSPEGSGRCLGAQTDGDGKTKICGDDTTAICECTRPCVFIAYPYIQGIELFEHIIKDGSLRNFTGQDTANLLRPVIKAVAELHKRNIVHRDIKPQNLMYHDGHVTLVDFGRARNFGRDIDAQNTSASDITRGVTLNCGTPGYYPPEVFFGEVLEYEKMAIVFFGEGNRRWQ